MTYLLSAFETVAKYGEQITRRIGTAIAWLTAALALATALIVLLRLLFQWGSIGAQESLTYMHALVIMLASAYTLAEDSHVRVDILYRRLDPVRKAWINSIGTCLFLLPFTAFMFFISLEYVLAAWKIRESSADAGGLPAVFILKSLILCNAALLFIQGLADLARHLGTLTRKGANP